MSSDTQHDNSVDQESGCRVLTISASLEGAMLFIEQMKGLSASTSTNEKNSSSLHAGTSGPKIVPYTISNRYYSADIHFVAYELPAVSPGLFNLDRSPPPPAIVFVWIDGEPYAKQVEELSKTIALIGYEPEVSLAVRVSRLDAKPPGSPIISTTDNLNAPYPADENMDIDTTLMSFGFEYVDATRESSSRVGSESDSPDDVPSLPRVLDALSTIMWPSMRAASKSANVKLTPTSAFDSAHGSRGSAKRQWERDSIMEELLAVSGISGISGRDSLAHSGGDEDGGGQENGDTDDELEGAPFSPFVFSGKNSATSKPTFGPSISTRITSSGTRTWSSFSSPAIGFSNVPDDTQGEVSLSPTEIDATTPFGTQGPGFADGGPNRPSGSRLSIDELSGELSGEPKKKVSMGFEDDFTVFVSAPPLASNAAAVHGRPATWFPLDLSKAGFATQNTADEEVDIETPQATAIATGNFLGPAPDQSDRSGLMPSSAQSGLSYRSLGSVSDFGGSDVDVAKGGYTALGDDEDGDEREEEWEDEDDADEWEDVDEDDESDDKDMPTMDEVMDMAARIFGKAPLSGEKDSDYPLGFESAASVFSSQSVFAAASSTVESSRKAAIREPESAGIKSPSIPPPSNPKPKEIPPSSSPPSPSTSGSKTRAKEAELPRSQPATSQSTKANSGPDPAMLERMRRLGGMAAMSDIQFGMAATRMQSAAKANPSTNAPERPVFGPPRPPPQAPSPKAKDNMDSEGEDSDIPPFDLTRVLHSLQAVRGEIAGMDDEEERRKMAAKVALGFVYGMDMKGESRGGLGGQGRK